MLKKLCAIFAFAFFLGPVFLCAAPMGRTLGFQGQLFGNGVALNTSVNATFTFYDALTGGSVSGSPISKTVSVTNGYFGTQFTEGDITGVDFGQQMFLEVNINGTTLSPRTVINASVAALRSFGTFSYASAPAVGPAGSLYFNTTDSGLYVSDGSNWVRSDASWLTSGTSTFNLTGNVGIGTSTPGRILTVNSGTSNNALFTGSGSSVYTSFAQTQATSSEFRIWPHSNGNIYLQHDRPVHFTPIDSTSPRLSITTSAEIGVATSSPVAALAVQKNTNSAQGIWVSNIGTTASTSARITLSTYGTVEGSPSYIDWSAYNYQLKYTAGRNNLGQHLFNTISGGVEQPRFAILNNGNIGIGTTTPNQALVASGTIQATSLYGGATTLSVDANGNIIRTPSDAKLKTNVETLVGALEKVNQLRGVSYNWIDAQRFGSDKEIGFIAQELETVVPEVVKSGGEYKSVNYQNLVALLTEAIKELSSKFSGLAERLVTKFIKADEIESENIIVKKLCIEDVCVTKEQLQSMIISSGGSVGTQANPSEPMAEATSSPAVEEQPVASTSQPVIEETPVSDEVENIE